MIASAFGVLFDGFAYGMLLFLLSVGLSVTLGMMNFVNLAHCSFAMLGGYVTVSLTNELGWPFLATLPLAFLSAAVVSVAFERVLYRRLYRSTDLDQCLLTIGIVFVSVAVAAYVYGTIQQPVKLPSYLRGTVSIMGQNLGVYRLFLIGMVVVITAALHALIERTRFGAQLRAAVDRPEAGAGLGIPVNRVFTASFAIGSGLAAVGGVLGVGTLGLDFNFTFRYMVYFLLVVVVGGEGSILGSAVAAISLGVFDVVGKYYYPSVGGFLIYALMVVLLLVFPHGLIRRGR